jgi:hypothetical protein
MVLAAATKLGRYEIRSKLGEGGMGEKLRQPRRPVRRDSSELLLIDLCLPSVRAATISNVFAAAPV